MAAVGGSPTWPPLPPAIVTRKGSTRTILASVCGGGGGAEYGVAAGGQQAGITRQAIDVGERGQGGGMRVQSPIGALPYLWLPSCSRRRCNP